MAIDLRSDTVTLPPPEMLRAMCEAELGDDVFGEDPTVNELQRKAAELLGKEAALFVPSGTMSNLLAHMTHCVPGDELICGRLAHTINYEAGGHGRIAGLSVRTVPQTGAMLAVDDVIAAMRSPGLSQPRTALLWIEQPANGFIMPLPLLRQLAETAWAHGLRVHIDGSRVFNAAVALGIPARDIAQWSDSLTFCLSKGLSAPVGSLLVGSADFIARAQRGRKVLGGAMRQAGVLAAGGIHALDFMVARLADDHRNARDLAAGLATIPGLRVDRAEVETNIFFVELGPGLDPRAFVGELGRRGVLCFPPSGAGRSVRLVTHYGVSGNDVRRAIEAIREATDTLTSHVQAAALTA